MNKIGFTPPLPEREIRELSEGEIPYNLSRLEYAELSLNSSDSFDSFDSQYDHTKIGLSFIAQPKQDTIVVFVAHSPNASQKYVDDVMEHGRVCVDRFIKRHGWDWVKIEYETSHLKINP